MFGDQVASKKAPASLASAAETMLTALRDAGRLESVDDLRVALVRGLAQAVSEQPANAALWRELRAVEISLRTVVDDPHGDDLSALLAALGDSSQPGSGEPRT